MTPTTYPFGINITSKTSTHKNTKSNSINITSISIFIFTLENMGISKGERGDNIEVGAVAKGNIGDLKDSVS